MPFTAGGASRPIEGERDLNELTEDLIFWSLKHDSSFTVNSGAPTNFASIPRLLRWLVPRAANQKRSAALHDYLYTHKNRYEWLDRERCDALFLEALRDDGVRWSIRNMMYLGVRIGGWVGFREPKNAKRRRL